MVEAAKKIASIWMEMAQLLRFELYILTIKFVDSYTFCRKQYVIREKKFMEDIVDLAKSIDKVKM